MPFKSDKQRAFLAINKPAVAKKFAADSPKKPKKGAIDRAVKKATDKSPSSMGY